MKVEFPLLDKIVEVEPGSMVSDACFAAGVPLDLVCGGNGTCEKCLVDIMEDGQRKSVLGCLEEVKEGMKVLAAEEQDSHQLLETAEHSDFVFDPDLESVAIPRTELVTAMGTYDVATLYDALSSRGYELEAPDYDTMILIQQQYRSEEGSLLNVVVDRGRIIDLVPGDEELTIYGTGTDVGTTSVVMFLYDLKTGTLLGQASALNGQTAFGADVISRIEHAGGSEENLRDEQAAIHKTLDGLLTTICEKCDVDPNAVYEMVYSGNSTMQHLFMGFDPYPLGRSPFTGLMGQEATMPASKGLIHMNPRGIHIFMPLLGAYVGADTLACMLELPSGDDKVRMTIDLGTNCEVTIGNDSRNLVASTACGPALEGAGIELGMRGKNGAIETVAAEDGKIVVGVIGDVAPIGLCGSGIIDAVAVLFQEGVINSKGAFLKGKKLEANPWHDKVRESEERGRYFVLVEADDNPNGTEIYITQKDIRAIQLAKAAIHTGYTLLINSYGIEKEDIEEVWLAGAYGNYINIENAQSIGLIPHFEGVPVHRMGNGAGLGAQRYLKSRPERKRGELIRANATHVELADDPAFRDVYIGSMTFGDDMDQ